MRRRSLEPILASLAGAWLPRRQLAAPDVHFEVTQSPTMLRLVTASESLGNVECKWVMDGRFHPVRGADDKWYPSSAKFDEDSGDIIFETLLTASRDKKELEVDEAVLRQGKRSLFEIRHMRTRETSEHVLTLLDERGQAVVTAHRVLVRKETDAEKIAAVLAESHVEEHAAVKKLRKEASEVVAEAVSASPEPQAVAAPAAAP